jgi:superfamily I DNA/RNA helicase
VRLDIGASLNVCWQGNVFVVGDPDQAIYSWRGALISQMSLSFVDDFPGDAAIQRHVAIQQTLNRRTYGAPPIW